MRSTNAILVIDGEGCCTDNL